MKVFHYDLEGYFLAVSELDETDVCRGTGEWLIPAQATEKEPLEIKEGFDVLFINNEWIYKEIVPEQNEVV